MAVMLAELAHCPLPRVAHPAWELLEGLQRLLDGYPTEVPALAPGEFRQAVAETDRMIQRLHAVKLRLLAAADTADVSNAVGLVDTGAWLAQTTRTGSADASRQVALARNLDKLPATASALTQGGVSIEHAAVISHTHRQLPDTLTDDQRAAVEQKLLGWAQEVDPTVLRRKARQVLTDITSDEAAARHHAEQLVSEERAALAKARLTVHDNHDGTTTGHFTVPTLAGHILTKILQQLTAPRRARAAGSSPDGSGQIHPDPAHLRGLAFTELLEHLPTDRLPAKTAATVVITLQRRQLIEDLGAAGADTGHELSPAEARRIACGAGILPAVLDGDSLPLDLGRTKRLFTEAHRVALATRHTTCSADGCDRPFAWCELHHHHPWASGGTTDLHQAVPLCGWHHRRIHDPAYHHTRQPDGSLRFHRRT